MITAGDKFPSVTIKEATAEGPKDVDPAALFAGKHVVLFSLPGAFTPTCSKEHLPGYVARYDELRGDALLAKGDAAAALAAYQAARAGVSTGGVDPGLLELKINALAPAEAAAGSTPGPAPAGKDG